MKDKFEVFNELELEKDYEEVTLSLEEKSEIKKRMNERLNKDRDKKSKLLLSKIKKYMLVGSIVIATTGAVVVNTNPSLAEEIESRFEEFLGIDKEKLEEYKVSKDLVATDKGIDMHIKEVILDDKKLILDIDMDYRDFKEYNIDEYDLALSFPVITIGDKVFAPQSSSSMHYYKDSNKKSVLFEADLSFIDIDGDRIGDEEYEMLENMNPSEDYDMKIEFNRIDCMAEKSEMDLVIEGKWSFETSINVGNIIKDTKVINVNKNIEIDNDLFKGSFIVDEVRISPIYTKIKFSYKCDDVKYFDPSPFLYVIYEDGQNQPVGFSGGGDGINTITFNGEFPTREGVDSFKLVPAIYINDNETEVLHEGSIEVKIP